MSNIAPCKSVQRSGVDTGPRGVTSVPIFGVFLKEFFVEPSLLFCVTLLQEGNDQYSTGSNENESNNRKGCRNSAFLLPKSDDKDVNRRLKDIKIVFTYVELEEDTADATLVGPVSVNDEVVAIIDVTAIGLLRSVKARVVATDGEDDCVLVGILEKVNLNAVGLEGVLATN